MSPDRAAELAALAGRLVTAGVDYDTAEGIFLDLEAEAGEAAADEAMALLDDAYGR